MDDRLYRAKRLANKNFIPGVCLFDVPTWRRAPRSDPRLPLNVGQLKTKITKHRSPRAPPPGTRVTRDPLGRRGEECDRKTFFRFFTTLGNPLPRNRDRDETAARTNNSTTPTDNIADVSIVSETGDFPEAAWERYNNVFDKFS